MRPVLALLLLPPLACPVFAQEAPPPQPARQTWEQHFTQADLAHDGRLTREEAKGGYALVAKHFDEIDVDHKGYVTADDIRAWRVIRKTTRRQARPAADSPKPQHALRPRHQDSPVPVSFDHPAPPRA
jgi:hypothetical protein